MIVVKREEAITSQQSLSEFLKEKDEAETNSQLRKFIACLIWVIIVLLSINITYTFSLACVDRCHHL